MDHSNMEMDHSYTDGVKESDAHVLLALHQMEEETKSMDTEESTHGQQLI